MGNQWPSPIIQTGGQAIGSTGAYVDFTTAQPIGLPRLSSPIPGVAAEYVLQQDFVQLRTNFSPLALNTAHPSGGMTPDYSAYLLVEEGPRDDFHGGLVKWTRTYAKTPATHYDWQTTNYSFIGYTLNLGSGTLQTRTRQQRTITSQIEFDYFLVPSTGVTDPILGGAPFNITTAGDIPKIWGMQYVSQGVIGGATYGGIFFPTDALNLAAAALPTWPSSEEYQAMVNDALQYGWNAKGITGIPYYNSGTYTTPGYTLSPPGNKSIVIIFPTSTLAGGPPPTSGHNAGVIDPVNSVLTGIIPAADSRLVRWKGNIYQRTTQFVLAQ